MGLRTQYDKVTDGERAFMFASTEFAIIEGDVPVKVRNFGTKKDGGKN